RDRPRPGDARPATMAAVLGVWAVCVLLLLLYLEHRPKPTASADAAAAPTAAAFPAPPAGAVVFSREAGPDALALGIVPLGGGVALPPCRLGQRPGPIRTRTGRQELRAPAGTEPAPGPDRQRLLGRERR